MNDQRLHREIEFDVSQYLPSGRRFEWRAEQQTSPDQVCIAFSWNGRNQCQGACCYSMLAARQAWGDGDIASEAWSPFVHTLVAQLLGYEVDSSEDLCFREDEAMRMISVLNEELAKIDKQLAVWLGRLDLVIQTRRKTTP